MMDGAHNCPMQLGVHKYDENGYDMQRNNDPATVALAAMIYPRGLCTLRMRLRQAARPASAAP
jgi:hypothetical protein